MPAKDTETRRWNKDVQRLHSQHDFVVKNFPKRPYLREFENIKYYLLSKPFFSFSTGVRRRWRISSHIAGTVITTDTFSIGSSNNLCCRLVILSVCFIVAQRRVWNKPIQPPYNVATTSYGYWNDIGCVLGVDCTSWIVDNSLSYNVHSIFFFTTLDLMRWEN